MLEKKEFDRLVRRYGPLPIGEAIRIRQLGAESSSVDRFTSQKVVADIFHLLFDPDFEAQNLWEDYQGVSEPATVPHQSPGARDTPSSGSRDGKEI